MQATKMSPDPQQLSFNLDYFFKKIFALKPQEKVTILIDLQNPEEIVNFAFLNKPGNLVQKKAYEVFYQGLKALNIAVDFLTYQMQSGHHLEIPTEALSQDGSKVDLKKEVYPISDVILCIGDYSATVPLTAYAKEYGFRGATMPLLNELILKGALSEDFDKVAKITEKVRLGLTGADSIEIEMSAKGQKSHLRLYLGDQVAQKNDGTAKKKKQIVNLPGGKVYFTPLDAEGSFFTQFTVGLIGEIVVSKGRVKKIKGLSDEEKKELDLQKRIESDKVTGIIGELGLGVMDYPYSGIYSQDGKILGSLTLGLGRNDHLNGSVTPARFKDKKNSSHQDILFHEDKCPEIELVKVTLNKNGKSELLIENNKVKEYLLNIINI